MSLGIWWLRRDLRLADNPALQAALNRHAGLVPLFILDPALLGSPYAAEKRNAFLFEGLRRLDEDLHQRGSTLVIRQGRPEEELARLVEELHPAHGEIIVYAQPDVSPYASRRDRRIDRYLPVEWVGSPAVFPPGVVVKPDGSPYTVFTPFSKAWKALPFSLEGQTAAPAFIPTPPGISGRPIPHSSYPAGQLIFTPGEASANARLQQYTAGAGSPIEDYAERRNRLDLQATSGLSAYLRFGMLSPRRAASAALECMRRPADPAARQGAESWLNELIWREFYLNLLYHFPHARTENFRKMDVAWGDDPARLRAWEDGRTGYPVVDAAMRQLAAVGWMHNRARMIVASFLTKDLLVDWRHGERWFMQHLLDGDPASNNGGWQWTAGTGADAAPYFRIFNPVSQGQKFDPQGDYVRRWLPELANVPGEYIHAPWLMPAEMQRSLGCRIGKDYPNPIVDHQAARQQTLVAYGQPGRKPAISLEG